METTVVYRGYIEIMEKEMETTTWFYKYPIIIYLPKTCIKITMTQNPSTVAPCSVIWKGVEAVVPFRGPEPKTLEHPENQGRHHTRFRKRNHTSDRVPYRFS